MYVEQVAINLLKEELLTTINNHSGSENYEFFIDVDFKRYKDKIKNNTIFFLISLDEGEIGFGSTFVNCNINCLSNSDNIDFCREIFNDFTKRYNLVPQVRQNNYIIQAYTTPATSSNFNKLQSEYGSLLVCSASYSISTNLSVISDVKCNTGASGALEEIQFIDISFDYVASNDVKSFPQTYNAYTKSLIQSGTVCFTIQAYFKTSVGLVQHCVDITNMSSQVSQDKAFNFTMNMGGTQVSYNGMKLIAFKIMQQPQNLPVCVMSFSQ